MLCARDLLKLDKLVLNPNEFSGKISELRIPDVRMIKYSSLRLEAKFEEFFLMNSLCSHNIRFFASETTPLTRGRAVMMDTVQ